MQQGRPSNRFGVDLAETMTVGLPSACQVVGDAQHKQEQERQRADGCPPGRGQRQQRPRHCQLGQRQEHPSGSRKPGGHAKIAQGLARPLQISQLGHPGDQKDDRE